VVGSYSRSRIRSAPADKHTARRRTPTTSRTPKPAELQVRARQARRSARRFACRWSFECLAWEHAGGCVAAFFHRNYPLL